MHASLSDIIADVAANSIEARASRVDVSVVEEGGVITLSVKDNGKGMDEATKARAFNPFYTEPGKHDKRKIGMGLPFREADVRRVRRNGDAREREGRGHHARVHVPGG